MRGAAMAAIRPQQVTDGPIRASRVASARCNTRSVVWEPSMHHFLFSPQCRPLRLYLLGLALIFAGAWAMGEYHSMLPMALASSAGLMLSAPLLRQLIQRAMRPAASKRR